MDSWEHLKELFEEFFQLPPEQRAAYMDQLCEDNASLRAELGRLLNADEFLMRVPAQRPMKMVSSRRKLLSPCGPEVVSLNGAV